MRKLPYLLVLLLLSLLLLAAAASAHALILPSAASQGTGFAAAADEEEAGEDDEVEADSSEDEGDEFEADDSEGEACGTEADELCEEETEEEAEECLLEDASASVSASPGNDVVRLTVHYQALEATMVDVDAGLHGGKGGLHLGSERVRFHRSGVYRDSFSLSEKQMARALAAREFNVDLRAVGTPADCELHLSTRASRRAR